MKKLLSIVLIILLSVTLTGCNMQNLLGGLLGNKEKTSSKSSPQQEEEKKIIAVAINQEDPNKDMLLLGIQELAEKEEIEVRVLGKEEQGDPEALKDAKILIVIEGEQSFLKNAEKEDIPILALNGLPTGVKAKGAILPDPEQVGKLMAQQIQGKVSEGRIVYLMGEADDPVAQMNLAAFRQELGQSPKVTIHSITNPPQSETIAIQSLMEQLQKNPGQVKAICAKDEKLISQAYELLRSMQLTETIHLMGGQANPKSLQRIASGSQVADIDTAPYVQGVNAFQWAQKLMDNQSMDITQSVTGDQGEVAAKLIPVKTVTTENLALVQKSYTKASEARKELEKKQKEAQAKGSGSQGGKEEEKKNSGSNGEKKPPEKEQSGQDGQDGDQQGGQGGEQGVMPEGVKKVTEKVRTEIIREYLDEKGNVLGTEKSANDQVRTIPPEMLLKEQQQKQQGGQGQQEKQGEQQEGGSEEKKKDGESP